MKHTRIIIFRGRVLNSGRPFVSPGVSFVRLDLVTSRTGEGEGVRGVCSQTGRSENLVRPPPAPGSDIKASPVRPPRPAAPRRPPDVSRLNVSGRIEFSGWPGPLTGAATESYRSGTARLPTPSSSVSSSSSLSSLSSSWTTVNYKISVATAGWWRRRASRVPRLSVVPFIHRAFKRQRRNIWNVRPGGGGEFRQGVQNRQHLFHPRNEVCSVVRFKKDYDFVQRYAARVS